MSPCPNENTNFSYFYTLQTLYEDIQMEICFKQNMFIFHFLLFGKQNERWLIDPTELPTALPSRHLSEIYLGRNSWNLQLNAPSWQQRTQSTKWVQAPGSSMSVTPHRPPVTSLSAIWQPINSTDGDDRDIQVCTRDKQVCMTEDLTHVTSRIISIYTYL